MLKKILVCVLTAALILTALPMTAFAAKNNILYGDVNCDGSVNPLDILMLKRYIAGYESKDFSLTNADVNNDKKADPIDVLMIKKSIAGYDVLLGPALLTVSFYDGDRLIDSLTGRVGLPLGEVPSTEKTSRTDAIFAGWYTDAEFTKPFYADSPLTGDTKVYAKYDELKDSELTLDSFAQIDLSPNAAFTVVGEGNLNDIELVSKDGSDPVKLNITGTNPYTVKAENGFKEGASYELTLPKGLNFVGTAGVTMPDTIRTASFTIKKEAVDNLRMSNDIHYVQSADPSTLEEGSTVALTGAKTGDLICFYKNTSPVDRDYKSGNAYTDDPETWFKVGSVHANSVTLKKLDETDSEKLYDIPDNFPVTGVLPTGNNGVLTLDGKDSDGYALDNVIYQQIVGEDETADLAYANKKISVGDFISIYVSSDEIHGDDDIYFGKITAYDSSTGEITYIKSSAEEIESSMDLYIQPVLDGDDLLSEESKKQIEQTVLEQVKNSGFAEEAGFMLADMATRTDGFRNMEGIQMLLTDENGNPLSDDEIALLNLGKSFELSDGISLTVEIITSGDQIHFKNKGSVQLAIGIDAQFEVEVEDGGKIVIDLSATFVQELALGITANGELVKIKILGIPVPVGVKVGSSVDILSYTAVRVDVQAYTVAEEDTPIWEQLKEIVTNPEKLVDVLPAGNKFDKIKKGLNTVGQVFDKIDEVKGKIEQVRDDAEQAKRYADDLEMLWEMVGEMKVSDLPTKDKWENIGKTLCKTNVSKDLMDMLGLSTETELDADRYTEGLEGLLNKYSEMLQNETDWVKLVQKEIFQGEYYYCGLAIYIKADFVVRTDMNIAMGTSIQYQVGRRYSFWMKIGLFIPQAGSSTMDLVDEEFAFQFYVMGKLGIKMGVEATVGFAIGSADAARVGLHVELGPYVKLYGFFIYEYERTREANTSVWKTNERMAGAMYLEFGLYLVVGIDAAALNDMLEISYDFIDAEYPLLEAGKQMYPYRFNYETNEGELVLIQDEDADNTNGIKMTLPDEYKALSCCNLTNGRFCVVPYDWNCYNYSFSNPAFSVDENGMISVDVPTDTRYIECDLTLTYKYGKLAFSTYDMQVTVPLVWTNLPTAELSQYYTASVRVGNSTDGYNTVWSTRVRKNQEFTLPTEAELKELIGYSDAMYASLSFPDAGKTEKVISNISYDCTVAYTDYAVTVNEIQFTDGHLRSETFHTTYGGVFDFSSLSDTGTRKTGTVKTARFEKYIGVTTTATITANGQEQVIDLTQPISGKVAEAIRNGNVKATAQYVDDSVLVTYVFSGIDMPDYSERILKGSESYYDFNDVIAQKGMAVKAVTPALGKVYSTTTYFIECGKIEGPSFTVSFEENGGQAVTDITRVGGSLIGNLPVPERAGYTFGGWYANSTFTVAFTARLMPKENTTVYAKWTANTYALTLNVNGGNSWTEGESPVTVTYDSLYNTLPVPTRDGYSFIGWFTEAEGGSEVTSQTRVSNNANHTLYAHWHKLVEIAKDFVYNKVETTYKKATQVENIPTAISAGDVSHPLKLSDFTVKFMRQGSNIYCDTPYPIDAGVWDAVISYPGDNYYAPFEQVCSAVTVINKATRTLGKPEVVATSNHFSYINLKLTEGTVDDLNTDARITFEAYQLSGTFILTELIAKATSASATEPAKVFGLTPDSSYVFKVSVTGDPNYNDVVATGYSNFLKTDVAPSGNWIDYAGNFTFGAANTYEISSEQQLAILTKQVSLGNTFEGYTFKLTKDIDLSEHQWTPIGTGEKMFRGIFDGNNYTVRGIYSAGFEYSGFIGSLGWNGGICNLTVEDSYMYGDNCVAGIAAKVDSYQQNDKNEAFVINCTNRATVCNISNSQSIVNKYYSGGIVGYCASGIIKDCVNEGRVSISVINTGFVGGISASIYLSGQVINCINYGTISGNGDSTGGLVGYISYSTLANSVNFGNVTGTSCVGGVAGYNGDSSSCKILNCYTVGTVKGTDRYVGAVAGRNAENKGVVKQAYYLQYSATRNGANRNALGTKTGTIGDGTEGTQTAYFTSPTSYLSRDAEFGTANLITALNNWVDANADSGYSKWTAGPNGYPLPIG